ncbi:uncharacterized protein LOC131875853 [Cryptomeria japonica]|uniref:uncharacterized protein LOC131875853 n=1 Tax=Cryptomeria japonica TaxID=3369 RepID=UPI0027DAA7D5|nr:uncharacterized protein LOC131875853 [Cryptomeria japonica]
MGDFNTPLQESEKFGGSQIQMDSKQDLLDFINDQCLIDLDLSGDTYTLTNRRVGDELIQVRLDRTLISTDWLYLYFCSLKAMSKVGSDHFPISFTAKPKGGRRRFSFRFEMMWLSYPSLHNCVKDWWDVKIDGTTLFSVAKKLRIVKEKIIKWNKEMFGDIFMLKSAPQVDLNIIKDKIQKEGYVGDNFARESDIVSKFHSIISREEIFRRQRLRSLWLNAGDRNTRFFHITTLKHKVANIIDRIISNGIKREDKISEDAVEFFDRLLKADSMLDLEAYNSLAKSTPRVLSIDQNRMLAAIPSNEEIKKVVFSFDGNKAPSLDGLPMFFFQNFWDIVESDVSSDVKEFFGARSLLKELNATFIVLIPKKKGANSLDAFWPINLCNSFNKSSLRS